MRNKKIKKELEEKFEMFKNKKIDIFELQNRLSTVYCEKDDNLLRLVDNELERIIFCCKDESYYEETIKLYQNIKNVKWLKENGIGEWNNS